MTTPPPPPPPLPPPPASSPPPLSAPQLRVDCPDAVATQNVAARLARFLVPGDVVLLGGDLGAGKTTFTQGLARALGISDVVTSPTFTLVRCYPTGHGFDLLHADVYRLERLSEIVDLGLPEQLEDGAVAVIEWGERAAPALRPDYLEIGIEFGRGDGERQLAIRPVGAGWSARWPYLVAAMAIATTTAGAADR